MQTAKPASQASASHVHALDFLVVSCEGDIRIGGAASASAAKGDLSAANDGEWLTSERVLDKSSVESRDSIAAEPAPVNVGLKTGNDRLTIGGVRHLAITSSHNQYRQ